MSATATAPRRLVLVLLLVVTIAWAASNLITLIDQIKFFDQSLNYGPDTYRRYLVVWIVASLVAVLALAPAIIALARPRAAHWVAGAAALSTILDFGTTVALNTQYNSDFVGRALKLAYIDGFSGDYGWKQVNGVLGFWLAVPVIVLWIIWFVARPAATPSSYDFTPAPQTLTFDQPPHVAQAPATTPAVVDAWWVQVSGSSYGPYTWAQLTAYAADGRVAADALVRRADGPFVPLHTLTRR